MTRTDVEQAIQQLTASGQEPTARAVRDLVGGRMSTVLGYLRELKAAAAPDGKPLRDWRESSDVRALNDFERTITDELASLRASLSQVQAKLDEGPQLYHRMKIDEHLKRVPVGAAEAFQTTIETVGAEGEALEAEIILLTEELAVLRDVRFGVQETAKLAAADTVRAGYIEKSQNDRQPIRSRPAVLGVRPVASRRPAMRLFPGLPRSRH